MPTRAAVELLERYNRAIAGLEDATVARLHTAMDRAYRGLERELRRTYPAIATNQTLLATQRKTLILEQLGETLQVVQPAQAQFYQQTLQDTLQTANQTGRTMADELISAVQPNTGIPELGNVNLEAAALQARDGLQRLRRHSEEFRDKASAVIEQGLIQGWGPAKVADILRGDLQTTKSKAETIARTEILSALNDAAQQRYAANEIEGVQVICTIGGRSDVCPVCVARNTQVYPVGKIRVPFHPRCRCILLPFRPSWQEKGLTDDEFIKDYQGDRLAELTKAGLKPNNGLTPFEKAAGLTEPPKPIWSISSDRRQTGLSGGTSGKGIHTELIELGESSASKSRLQSLDRSLQPSAKLTKLINEQRLLEAEVDRLLDDDSINAFASPVGKRYLELDRLIKAENEKARAKALGVMQGIRADLQLKSGVTADEARQMANAVKIRKAALKGTTEQEMRDDLQNFFQITGGRGAKTLKMIVLDDDRAYADDSDGSLNVGKQPDRDNRLRVIFHEVGHFVEVEDRPGVGRAAESWVRARATGEETKLSILTGDNGYSDVEKAIPDKFIHPYVGKLYGDDTGEVVSMGLEHFRSPETMLELYEKDREHFLLTVGAIRKK